MELVYRVHKFLEEGGTCQWNRVLIIIEMDLQIGNKTLNTSSEIREELSLCAP